MQGNMKIRDIQRRIGTVASTVLVMAVSLAPLLALEEDLGDRSRGVANDAKELAVDAGQSVAAEAEALWQRLDEEALASRTGHEVLAWMIVGGLVGAVAGMLTSMRSTGFGRLGRLLLGLMGAFIGGLAVRLGSLDFGWQPLQIRYEDLLFSFAGAVMLILLWRLARASTQKKHA
jgi:uncharacterized membrane protein YeaQ/YmgE (transglycosylase-associated protein family)